MLMILMLSDKETRFLYTLWYSLLRADFTAISPQQPENLTLKVDIKYKYLSIL